jgi:hypothetical protein
MGIISRVDFVEGDIPSATLWNSNFNTAYTEINGSLDSNNLASDAVTTAKIQDNAVTTDKLGDIPAVALFSVPYAYEGTSIRTIMFPFAGTISQVSYKSGTTPSPESLVFDILNDGSTIFTASAASATGTTAVDVTTGLQNTSVLANGILTLDIDAIGTATAGGEPFTVSVYIDVSGSDM